MTEIRFPEIIVNLTGGDGNAFAILGKVQEAMKLHNIDKEIRGEFAEEAISGDYDHLLRTAMRWVTIE